MKALISISENKKNDNLNVRTCAVLARIVCKLRSWCAYTCLVSLSPIQLIGLQGHF